MIIKSTYKQLNQGREVISFIFKRIKKLDLVIEYLKYFVVKSEWIKCGGLLQLNI